MEYKYKKITLKDIHKLTKLIDASFSLKTKKKNKLVNWKFFQPDRKLLFAYGAYDKNSELVSFYSDKFQPTTNSKKFYKSSICLDMCTTESHRRKGLISKLSRLVYNDIKSKNFDFSFGFSNKHGVKVDKYSSDYGYSVVGQFKTYRKFLLPTIAKNELEIKKINLTNLKGLYINDFFQIVNDKQYLKWRYADAVTKKDYIFFEVFNNKKTIGYVVIDEKKRSVGVLKILSKNPTEYNQIIKAISKYYFNKKKIYMSLTILPNKFWNKLLKKSKFINIGKKEQYFFTVFKHKKINNLLDSENWLLMGGDII